MNTALVLTTLRIILIPIVGLFYFLPIPSAHFFAALVFGIAAGTDWLDGYLARHYQQSTKLGAFLDPVADKLIVVVALTIIVGAFHDFWITLPAAIIIGREIMVSALREWMAELGKRKKIAVTTVAKVKTMVQMFALAMLLWYTPEIPWHHYLYPIGVTGLYISSLLTLWSMGVYIKAAIPDLTLSLKKQ